MGFNLTWLTAHEESLVDDTLLSVGRRSTEERIATLMILLYKRAAALQPNAGAGAGGVLFPLTRQHVADAPGLSLVHTNIVDVKTLARLADVYGDARPPTRPLVSPQPSLRAGWLRARYILVAIHVF